MGLRRCLMIIFALGLGVSGAATAAGKGAAWPSRVLLSNDDGIDEPTLAALAKEFAAVSETYVIAPLDDRSGTTHFISAFRTRALRVEPRPGRRGGHWYGVDGYPGDCVLLALTGLMRESPPDLVVTGINGGPNLGFDWIASGTIGAARVAAVWGVPAIAVSGMDASIPGALDAAVDFVVRLAKSPLVESLDGGRYLTVSIPRLPPADIRGVRIAQRAGVLLDFSFSRASASSSAAEGERWQLLPPRPRFATDAESDASLYARGWVVVVPMRANEDDFEALAGFRAGHWTLPRWTQPAPGGTEGNQVSQGK